MGKKKKMSQTNYLSKIFFDGFGYFDPFEWKYNGKKEENKEIKKEEVKQ